MSRPNNYAAVLERATALLRTDYPEDHVEFDATYSGRSMYGNTTPAIITSINPMLISFAITKAVMIEEDNFFSIEDVKKYFPMRSDSMGYDKVFY